MKSIVISTLCVAFLGAFSNPAAAQQPDGDLKMATDEAVRREALKIELSQKLADAMAAERKGALMESSRLYSDCLDLVRKIGVGGKIDTEHKAALAGHLATRAQLAEQAQRAGDYAAADAQFALILKEDAKNEEVKQLRAKNEQMRLANAGRRPPESDIAAAGPIYTNRVQSLELAHAGRMYLEAGKYDLAESKLRQALKLDPTDSAADYYLKLTLDKQSVLALTRKENADRGHVLEVEKSWAPEAKVELPVPNSYATTNFVKTSKARQRIYQKLDTIRVDNKKYDAQPLSQVIDDIHKDAKNRDAEKIGINIVLSATADPAASAAPTIDPGTGLPAAGAAVVGEGDIGSATIKIDPALSGVTLHQLLDIIVKVSDRPIKYSVEDWGILFTTRGQESPTLHTRWYKIDPNTFVNGLQGVVAIEFSGGGSSGGGGGGGGRGGGGGGRGGGGGGRGGGNNQGGNQGSGGQGQSGSASYASVSIAAGGQRGGQQGGGGQQPGGARGGQAGGGAAGGGGGIDYLTSQTSQNIAITTVKNYFETAGVTLDAPKSVVFNDRLGMLMVRATLQDLDLIEQAVQVLNMIPPQVQIDAKIAEVGQDDSRALGFDWFWGNTLAAGGKVGLQGGTAPTYNGRPSAGNPSGVFPGPLPSGVPLGSVLPATVSPAATDNFLTSSLRNSAPALATVSGILTDPQFRMVIRALEQRQGVSFIASPRVLTPSGRQAQLKTVEIRTIVTGLLLDQTSGGGGGGNNGNNGNNGGGGVGSIIEPDTEPFELGPTLDVIPYVSADGYTIQLTIIPTLKEFVGYDLDSARIFSAQIQSVSGTQTAPPIIQPTPLPIFRLRQVVTSAIVWDGQTVALGGLLADETTKIKDKVPLFGDLPFVGRLFRSESSVTKKKNLMIFVTPTIIDPAGNRVHTDEDMPFAANAFPTQRTVTP